MQMSVESKQPQSASSSPAVDTVLDVRDLRTSFRTPAGEFDALRGVSLQLARGEAVGLVGTSGAGKTLLARSIMGLVKEPGYIAGGSIQILGRDVRGLSEKDLRAIRGNDVAIIFANPRSRLNPLVSVGNQLANVIRSKQELSKREAAQKAVAMLGTMAIGDPDHVARLLPIELSGGMCQRVVVAMALANSPRLLLADEPTAGLDVTVQVQVLGLMRHMVEQTGSSLLLMTRDLGIVAHYAKRVVVLRKGVIVEDQPVTEFFAGPAHEHSRRLLDAAFASRTVN
jgi:ABC-type dipeptide/oligopeptide/nickel transport system ATPase component